MAKVRLGDIATVVTKGTTPTTMGFQFEDSGINFVKIESISEEGTFLKEKFSHISDECNVQMRRSQLQENDILFSIAGAIGRSAIVTKEILPANTNQALAIIRVPEGKIDYNYLLYALSSSAINQQATQHQQGVAQLNISLKNVSDFLLPIYTEAMQKRIVHNLKKIDKLIFLRKQQLAKLDELVKARFAELFYGQGYPVLKWKDVFDTTTGKLDSNAAVENGIYPFFTCSKEVLRINKYAFEQKALLLAGNNAAGKYDVKYYNGKFNAYQRTYVLGLKENWSYRLFQYQLEDKLEYLQRQSLGGLTKYLTLKILGELDFIIPPKNKQDEFDTFVERVDRQKQSVQKSLEKLELMKKALMQEYFG